jgi:hypothetical protein
MATPAPAPVPAPSPTPAPAPSPWTLENFVLVIIAILGVLPSTFLKGSSTETLQIVGFIGSTLSAIAASWNNTSLKKAHLAHLTACHVVANENVPRAVQAGITRISVMMLVSVIMSIALLGGTYLFSGCGAGNSILKAGECIIDNGVLATVVKDLASADYAALLAQLDPSGTDTLVGCALNTCANLDIGVDAGYSVVAARARELIAKRGAAAAKASK